MKPRIPLFAWLLSLAGLYYLLFGRYGYFPSDQGFIPALAWRIWQGQVPYLDFIYVRPALSGYLHAWEMALPETWLLQSGRMFFYLQMALATWCMLRSLDHSLGLQQRGFSLLGLGALALVGALHNYSPMPWHTVDGIFLGAAGVYLLVVPRRWGWWALGGWLLFGAALCKQSFYLMPLLGLGLLWLYQPRRYFGRTALVGWGSFVVLAGAVAWLQQDWAVSALAQTTGATSLRDLAVIGGWQYLKAVPPFALGVALVEFGQQKRWSRYLAYLWPAALLGGAALHLGYALWQQSYAGPLLAYGQLLWLAALAGAYGVLRGEKKGNKGNEEEKKGDRGNTGNRGENGGEASTFKAQLKDLDFTAAAPLLALLGLAWCASISWGYATPVLAFAPLAVGGWLGVQRWGLGKAPPWLLPATTVGLALIWGLCQLYPYREAPRYTEYREGGEVFPALSGLQIGAESYERLSELKQFARRYGDRFTVLSAYPAAHLMLQADPAFASDWAQNAEVHANVLLPTLQTLLDNQVAYVFLQKDKLDRLDDRSRYGLLLGAYVQETWDPVTEGKYFVIYRNPKLTERMNPGLALSW